MKPLFHLIAYTIVFALGLGVGVHYGARNPDQAATIADKEDVTTQNLRAELAQLKQQVTAKHNDQTPTQSPGDAVGHTKIYQDLSNGASNAIDNVGKTK